MTILHPVAVVTNGLFERDRLGFFMGECWLTNVDVPSVRPPRSNPIHPVARRRFDSAETNRPLEEALVIPGGDGSTGSGAGLGFIGEGVEPLRPVAPVNRLARACVLSIAGKFGGADDALCASTRPD